MENWDTTKRSTIFRRESRGRSLGPRLFFKERINCSRLKISWNYTGEERGVEEPRKKRKKGGQKCRDKMGGGFRK